MVKYIILLLSLKIVALTGCSISGDCENIVIKSTASTDGNYVATFYSRNCGATSDLAYIVHLRASEDRFDPDASSSYVFVTTSREPIDVEWNGEGLLNIGNVAEDPELIFNQQHKWKDVQIHYN